MFYHLVSLSKGLEDEKLGKTPTHNYLIHSIYELQGKEEN